LPGLRGGRAWALSNDLPNQISNFGGEHASWGPLLTTNYGFDTRIHNFASTSAANPCGYPPTLNSPNAAAGSCRPPRSTAVRAQHAVQQGCSPGYRRRQIALRADRRKVRCALAPTRLP